MFHDVVVLDYGIDENYVFSYASEQPDIDSVVKEYVDTKWYGEDGITMVKDSIVIEGPTESKAVYRYDSGEGLAQITLIIIRREQ